MACCRSVSTVDCMRVGLVLLGIGRGEVTQCWMKNAWSRGGTGVQMVRIRRFLVQLRVGVVRGKKMQVAHGERTEVTSRRRDVHSARCDGAVNESTVQMRAALVRVGGVAVPMRDRTMAVCDARRRSTELWGRSANGWCKSAVTWCASRNGGGSERARYANDRRGGATGRRDDAVDRRAVSSRVAGVCSRVRGAVVQVRRAVVQVGGE